MSGNNTGVIFRLTTFGESHGVAIGGVVEGCPAGLEIPASYVQQQLDRRRPGQSEITSPRKESDTIEILSGIFEGKTTGSPIGFIIRNRDARPGDYDELRDTFRPSHADYTWETKYGIRDHRGGGRASARETACRVAGGAIARLLLERHHITIQAWVESVGQITIPDNAQFDPRSTDDFAVRCPHAETAFAMEKLIMQARDEGDTLGGIITCRINGVPAGLGEPVFDKLHADLGKAMLSINAVKGFEIGSGFKSAAMKGSEHNDAFVKMGDRITTNTNHSGGIQGGISNGNEIYFRTAFKPVATIKKQQETVNREGKPVHLEASGRHDPCVLPRAVPVVEAMTALVMADHLLRNRNSKF
jgi:chorismate synthase